MLDGLETIGKRSHWALCGARYFDSATRRFRAADIEIGGGRIVALLPPGASGARVRVHRSNVMCVPGLISELFVDPGSEEFDFCAYVRDAVACGITTISVLTERCAMVAAAVRRAGLRAEIYCGVRDQSLGRASASEDGDAEHALDAYHNIVRSADDDRIRISPAIVSQSLASSSLTVQLHSLAQVTGKRLLVNIDSGGPHDKVFQDAYGCSGTLLLRCLDVLDAHTIAIIGQGLSRHDLDLLARSPACVAIVNASMITNDTRAAANLKRIMRSGRGALMCRLTDTNAYSTDGSQGSRTFGWSSLPNVDGIGDIIVDTMTHAGSAALGLPAIGRIEAGAHADFAVYDSPLPVDGIAHDVPDDLLLLELITTRRPRLVLIDGRWSVRDYVIVEDDAVRPGESL